MSFCHTLREGRRCSPVWPTRRCRGMTVRLLLSRVGDSASSPAWVTLLRSAGAHDTYLRTYRGVLDAARVVEFMLLDRLFPRSVFYSLRLAEHSLDELLHNPQSRIG